MKPDKILMPKFIFWFNRYMLSINLPSGEWVEFSKTDYILETGSRSCYEYNEILNHKDFQKVFVRNK